MIVKWKTLSAVANLLSQTVQCSGKLHKTQELRLRLFGPPVAYYMLMFMTVQLERTIHSKSTGPGHIAITETTMNSFVYQSIFESNVKPSAWQIKLGSNWVHATSDEQQHNILNNDLKHILLQICNQMARWNDKCKKITKVLQQPSRRLDLNLIEILRLDLKRAVHEPISANPQWSEAML